MIAPKMRLDYDPVDGRTESDSNHIGNGTGYAHGYTVNDTNARFWSKSGSDTNAGTQAAPFRTYYKAVVTINASATLHYAVCLDSGIYDEDFIEPYNASYQKYALAADGQSPTLTRSIGARTSFVPTGKYLVSGTEYFVDGVNGNDSWDGTAEVYGGGTTGPKKTIQAGVNLLTVAGDGLQIAEGEYDENVTLYNDALVRYYYAKEGEIPILTNTGAGGEVIQTAANVQARIEGLYINGTHTVSNNNGIVFNGGVTGGASNIIWDCTFINCAIGIADYANNGNTRFDRNYFKDCGTGIAFTQTGAVANTIYIRKNRFIDMVVWSIDAVLSPASRTCSIEITDNVSQGLNGYRFWLDGTTPTPPDWTIHRNTSYAYNGTNDQCYYFQIVGSYSISVRNNLAKNDESGGSAYCFYSNAASIPLVNCLSDQSMDNNVTYSNCVDSTDPGFVRTYGEEVDYLLGIRPDGDAFSQADDGYRDIGAELNLIDIAHTCEIDGFTMDGQDQYFCALRQVSGVIGGPFFKYNEIENFASHAMVVKGGSTFNYRYNFLRRNGNGIYFTGTVERNRNNIFHDNVHYGRYKDTLNATTYDQKCIYFRNRIGIYFSNNVLGATVLDSITQGNREYGIYSAGGITRIADNCLLADPYFDMDVSDAGNIFTSPLFVNIEEYSEDFHIRTNYGGYPFNSPCKDAASGGDDIGAWQVSRSGSISYSSFTFLANPFRMVERWEKVRPVESTAQSGKVRTSVPASNKVFELVWTDDYYSPDAQSELFDRLASEDNDMRFWPRGASGIVSGTGTVNGTNKTLTDATLSGNIRKDRFKTYQVLINSVYYRISANTTTGVFTLEDPDGSLPTGSYAYSIDHVLVRVRAGNRFRAAAPYLRDNIPRTGYNLELIEV